VHDAPPPPRAPCLAVPEDEASRPGTAMGTSTSTASGAASRNGRMTRERGRRRESLTVVNLEEVAETDVWGAAFTKSPYDGFMSSP
jgi:hypothetical protein